jgi:CspA family cold shock protein
MERPLNRGRVKWWNDAKGFGFITDDHCRDIFAHYTHIVGEGFKTLKVNSQVEFDLYEGPKGFEARNVRPK